MSPDRKAPEIRVRGVRAFVHEIRARMPFRYGNACLTDAPVLTVEVEIEVERGAAAPSLARGVSSDCLPPRWFDKDPKKTYSRDLADQVEAYRTARAAWLEEGATPKTAYELWKSVDPTCRATCADRGVNDLTASFGVSFLERATIDALGHAMGTGFIELLRRDLLGLPTSGLVPTELAGSVGCRHTVGLADPLTAGEIAPGERLDDGLPQALDECIERYGLRWFKVKVRGEAAADEERLRGIADVLDRACGDRPYVVSLDGNEQYEDVDALRELIETLGDSPEGRRLRDSVEYIEQPLAREVALEPGAAGGIASLSEYRPVIIDESDACPESFERALALGYRGTSHKNCKGIFKSLHNRALVLRGNAERGEGHLFQTAEDLANTPVVPLQQDLASVIALGIRHAERNGHHYFRGLDHLPRAEAEAAAREHADLYETRDGSIFVRIRDGEIECASLLSAAGYGGVSSVDLDSRTPLEDWEPPRADG